MMKAMLHKFCSSIQIEYVGIAPIGPYVTLEKILRDQRAKGQYTEFEEICLRKRIDPRMTMPDAQSIVVCLFPYHLGEQPHANVAKYAYSVDYHQIVKEKLEQVASHLMMHIPEFSYEIFVDTGPLVDRYLAYLAGLGFYGLNNHIISDKYGSYVVIGYILTNYPFVHDEPVAHTCMQCGRCVTACPGQAIMGDFSINPQKCRSYLTQKKGELTETEISIVSKNSLLFGCDICQDVCPHNQHSAITMMKEFRDHTIASLDCDEVMAMSNKEFMRRYGNRAFSWRGRKVIMRNFTYTNPVK